MRGKRRSLLPRTRQRSSFNKDKAENKVKTEDFKIPEVSKEMKPTFLQTIYFVPSTRKFYTNINEVPRVISPSPDDNEPISLSGAVASVPTVKTKSPKNTTPSRTRTKAKKKVFQKLYGTRFFQRQMRLHNIPNETVEQLNNGLSLYQTEVVEEQSSPVPPSEKNSRSKIYKLKCTLCNEVFDELSTLHQHLIGDHDFHFNIFTVEVAVEEVEKPVEMNGTSTSPTLKLEENHEPPLEEVSNTDGSCRSTEKGVSGDGSENVDMKPKPAKNRKRRNSDFKNGRPRKRVRRSLLARRCKSVSCEPGPDAEPLTFDTEAFVCKKNDDDDMPQLMGPFYGQSEHEVVQQSHGKYESEMVDNSVVSHAIENCYAQTQSERGNIQGGNLMPPETPSSPSRNAIDKAPNDPVIPEHFQSSVKEMPERSNDTEDKDSSTNKTDDEHEERIDSSSSIVTTMNRKVIEIEMNFDEIVNRTEKIIPTNSHCGDNPGEKGEAEERENAEAKSSRSESSEKMDEQQTDTVPLLEAKEVVSSPSRYSETPIMTPVADSDVEHLAPPDLPFQIEITEEMISDALQIVSSMEETSSHPVADEVHIQSPYDNDNVSRDVDLGVNGNIPVVVVPQMVSASGLGESGSVEENQGCSPFECNVSETETNEISENILQIKAAPTNNITPMCSEPPQQEQPQPKHSEDKISGNIDYNESSVDNLVLNKPSEEENKKMMMISHINDDEDLADEEKESTNDSTTESGFKVDSEDKSEKRKSSSREVGAEVQQSPFQCQFCEMSFTNSFSLKLHSIREHVRYK